MFRNRIDEIISSLVPSEAVYKASLSYNGGLSFSKIKGISALDRSFLTPTIVSCADERLVNGVHNITVQKLKATERCLQVCINRCSEFLENNLPNRSPKQSKLYKFFANLDSCIISSTKFEDTIYQVAEYMSTNRFEGKKDTKIIATLEILKILKIKLMGELGIEEPKPRARRRRY